MEDSSNSSIQEIPWQATISIFLLNLRDEIVAANEAPALVHPNSLKKLTKEATIMMLVMLTFTILAALGTSVSAYVYFLKNNGKRIIPDRMIYENYSMQEEMRLEKEKSFIKCYDYCKSFLKNFCLVRNGRRILKVCSSEDKMNCIQGLRIVGSSWIILCHVIMFYFTMLRDAEQAKSLLDLKASQLLLNGNFPVDMFFVISGFLNAFHFFFQYSRHNGSVSWFNFYFKRFVRLTPVYMIVLGFYTTLYTYTGTGIVWPSYDTNPVCSEKWWFHLLYIVNFNESAIECMPWAWQLAVDMQFYIISPLFMISLMRSPRLGYFLISASVAVSCVATFTIAYWFNTVDGSSRLVFHLADVRHFAIKFDEYLFIIHMQPYSRLCSYLVGVTLGYFLFKKNIKKNTIRNNKVTLYFGWLVTTILMWICFFSLHKRKEYRIETALYCGTRSLFSSCGVAWIIYVCLTGQAGVLNKCLSSKAILPLSRLSFCTYLVHSIILYRIIQQGDDTMEFNFTSMMLLYLYTCIFTYPVSFVLSILFEMPFLNILDSLKKETKDKTSSLMDSMCKGNPENHFDVFKTS